METSSRIGKFLFRQNINILIQYFNWNRCYKRVIIRGKQYQFLEINSNNYSSRNLVSFLLDFIHRFMVLVLSSLKIFLNSILGSLEDRSERTPSV